MLLWAVGGGGQNLSKNKNESAIRYLISNPGERRQNAFKTWWKMICIQIINQM